MIESKCTIKMYKHVLNKILSKDDGFLYVKKLGLWTNINLMYSFLENRKQENLTRLWIGPALPCLRILRWITLFKDRALDYPV